VIRRRATVVFAGLAVAGALGALAVTRLARARACSHAPESGGSEPFDPATWAGCPGPHRIAIARALVQQHLLVGRSLTEVVDRLGPIDTDPDGDRGWTLGEPEGSPSLMPNRRMLAVLADPHGRITEARVVDVFEGPALTPDPR
jgi:hypothetical protein